MNKLLACLISLALSAVHLSAEANLGQPIPSFQAKTETGKVINTDSLRGKFVVLEWYNPECPFVKKHYGSGNMQKLQKQYTEKGVLWFSVSTSAPDRQGHLDEASAQQARNDAKSFATALLLDSDGTIGKAFDARTTPHMFVIDPKGILIYTGAIDSNSSPNPAKIQGATNYVAQALDEAMAGKAVSEPVTEPYGCSVKY